MGKLIYEKEGFAIRGAIFEVYREKGSGFLESVYQDCLAIEFEIMGIPFLEQPNLKLQYKGRKLRSEFKPDFVCWGNIIVELKATTGLVDENRAQLHNYLRAAGLKLG